VEQGPQWLVELGYGGPAWLQGVIIAAMVVVLAIAAVAYHRNGFDLEVAREMSEIGGIVLGIWFCTRAIVELFAFTYAIDVLAGTVLGFLGGKGFSLAFWNSYKSSAGLDQNEKSSSGQHYD